MLGKVVGSVSGKRISSFFLMKLLILYIELWSTPSLNASSTSLEQNGSNKSKISSPYNLVHVTHVGFNPHTGEFTGMPKEWQILLQQSGITKKEQLQNPQVSFAASNVRIIGVTLHVGCDRRIGILQGSTNRYCLGKV